MNLVQQSCLKLMQRPFPLPGLNNRTLTLERSLARSVTPYRGATRHYKCERWKHHNSMFSGNIHIPLRVTPIIQQFSQDVGKQMTSEEIKRAIENISDKFSEAMELMNDVRSSVGTVYFSEDMEDTQAQVAETLNDYNYLLAQLNDTQKKGVIQSVGLKMEELKAQMSMLEELARE